MRHTFKIVINRKFGGFGLSSKAVSRLKELGLCLPIKYPQYEDYEYSSYFENRREDPLLVQVVEELGAEANGECAELKIEEVHFDPCSLIKEHDGYERVW